MDETKLKGHILNEYRREYKHCLISLKLAKKIVNKEFVDVTQPPQMVADLRRKWLEFFSHAELYDACHNCQGACCSKIYYTSPRIIELFYLLWQNPEFEFPNPDWQFLKAEIEKPTIRRWQSLYPCLFLSKNGCLLKENKSNTCLFHFECRTLQSKTSAWGLDSDINGDRLLIEIELIPWSRRILEYLGIKSAEDLTGHNIILFNYIFSPKGPEYLIDLLGSKNGDKKITKKPIFCPKDNVELKKAQREYKGKFYLLFQCPVCFAVVPVSLSSSSKWTDVPEAIDIDDKTMDFIRSIRD